MSDGDKKRGKPRIVTARITIHADGSVEYEGDPAAIAEALETRVRAEARQRRRQKHWGEIGPGAMTRLAQSFPSLQKAPGVEPWEPLTFLRWAASGVLSHGEVLAAKFVLSVWDPGQDWEKVARDNKIMSDPKARFARFDVFEAMNGWDQEHISAMLAWIDLPFFP